MKYEKKIGKMKRNTIQKGDLVVHAPNMPSVYLQAELKIPNLVIGLKGKWVSILFFGNCYWVERRFVRKFYG